ncbi:MAG: hypothetical protein R3B60_01530 [Candidatus Paceibacterota bacterium]
MTTLYEKLAKKTGIPPILFEASNGDFDSKNSQKLSLESAIGLLAMHANSDELVIEAVKKKVDFLIKTTIDSIDDIDLVIRAQKAGTSNKAIRVAYRRRVNLIKTLVEAREAYYVGRHEGYRGYKKALSKYIKLLPKFTNINSFELLLSEFRCISEKYPTKETLFEYEKKEDIEGRAMVAAFKLFSINKDSINSVEEVYSAYELLTLRFDHFPVDKIKLQSMIEKLEKVIAPRVSADKVFTENDINVIHGWCTSSDKDACKLLRLDERLNEVIQQEMGGLDTLSEMLKFKQRYNYEKTNSILFKKLESELKVATTFKKVRKILDIFHKLYLKQYDSDGEDYRVAIIKKLIAVCTNVSEAMEAYACLTNAKYVRRNSEGYHNLHKVCLQKINMLVCNACKQTDKITKLARLYEKIYPISEAQKIILQRMIFVYKSSK